MKLAALLSPSSAQALPEVTAMLAVQAPAEARTHCVTGTSGAVGGVSDGDRFSAVPSYYESKITGQRLFVSGTPLSSPSSVSALLRTIVELPPDAAAVSLSRLDGPFAAILFHPARSSCFVVTDALGMQPLYMVRQRGMLALASEARALVATGLVAYAPSPAGWGAFLSFRHPIAGYTLADGVQRVPAASILSYDALTDRVSIQEHSAWPRVIDPREVTDALVDEISDALIEDVKAAGEYHRSASLLLSGGYDSRLLLAVLNELGHRPSLLTHEHTDELFDLDSRIAQRVADEYELPIRRLRSSPDFFSSQGYLEHIQASDAAVPSLYLFIAQLCAALPPDVEAIWEGTFPGCFLYPVHQTPGGFDRYLADSCASPDSTIWRAAKRVLDGDFVHAMRASFRAALDEERDRYADSDDGVAEFVVRNRTRHRIAVNPLQVYGRRVLPLTPGLTRRFWQRSASVPYSVRAGHAFYRRLLQRRFPRALRVPVVSAGRVDALLASGVFPSLVRLQARMQLRAERLLQRLEVRCGAAYWEESHLVDEAVRHTSVQDADLDAKAVSRLQQQRPPYDPVSDAARQLLFYRFAARRTFSAESVPAVHLAAASVASSSRGEC